MSENDKYNYNDVTEFPEGYYELVGRITVRWSAFIWLLDRCCISLGDVSRSSGPAFMTNISSLPSKRAAFCSLMQLRKCPPEITKTINRLFDRALNIQGRRNSLIHGAWLFSGKTATLVRQHCKLQNGQASQIDINQDMQNLRRLYDEMEMLVNDFIQTFYQMLRQLQPLPQKRL